MLPVVTRLSASLIIAMFALACDGGSATSATAAKNAAATKGEGEAAPGPAAAADPGGDEGALGQLQAVDGIDLNAIVNKSPEQVGAVLGEPSKTGTDRISCVRFVPERVFFACNQEIRAYEHATFADIRIDFEDGKAARVAISGVPGSGAFDPIAAMAAVGVSVPGEPRTQTETLAPVDGSEGGKAEIWDWGNSSARMLVDGQQFRVRVSVVEGDWARSKVELINNTPLDDDQKARIKPIRGQGQDSSSSESEAVSSDPAPSP